MKVSNSESYLQQEVPSANRRPQDFIVLNNSVLLYFKLLGNWKREIANELFPVNVTESRLVSYGVCTTDSVAYRPYRCKVNCAFNEGPLSKEVCTWFANSYTLLPGLPELVPLIW